MSHAEVIAAVNAECAGTGNRDNYEDELPHERRARLLNQMEDTGITTGDHVLPETSPPPPLLPGDEVDALDYKHVSRATPIMYDSEGKRIAGTRSGVQRLSSEDTPEYITNPDQMPTLAPGESALQVKKDQEPVKRRRKHASDEKAPVVRNPQPETKAMKELPKKEAPKRISEESPNSIVFAQPPMIIEKESPLIVAMSKATQGRVKNSTPTQLERLAGAVDWLSAILHKGGKESVALTFPGMGTLSFPLLQSQVDDKSVTLCLQADAMTFVPEIGIGLQMTIENHPTIQKTDVVYSGGNIVLEGLGVVFISFLLHNAVVQEN